MEPTVQPLLNMRLERSASTKTNGFKVAVDQCESAEQAKQLMTEGLEALADVNTMANDLFPVG